MKYCCAAIVVGLLAATAQAEEAWHYLGVPYVTHQVPDEIMPELPDGAHPDAFPYDPCTLARPEFAGQPHQYYVDSVRGNDATAENQGRGSVAKPRKSLPNLVDNSWQLAAGEQVFIAAGSEFFTGEVDTFVTVHGTPEKICWILGVGGRPKFAGDKFFMGGSHLIVDNIQFERRGGMRLKFGSSFTDTHFQYGTLRNCVLDGLGTGANAAIGGSGKSAAERTSFICLYKNTIRNLGQWNRQDKQGKDRHGIQMTAYTDHWWIVENEVFHCEGDSVQINTSAQAHGDYARRPHYIYIAGNHFYENYENGIDNKNCFHTIQSQNRMHGFHNRFKGANETAYILANDSEGWLSGYEWALFNTIHDAGTGIRIAANAASVLDQSTSGKPVQKVGQKTFAIGNLIYDVASGVTLDARGTSPEKGLDNTWYEQTWLVSNTIVARQRPIVQTRGNHNSAERGTHTIVGNLVYNHGANPEIDLGRNPGQVNRVIQNFVARAKGTAVLDTGKYDAAFGNVIAADPKFTSLTEQKFTPQADSPATGIVKLSPDTDPYQLFADLYGIDIRKDHAGKSRPLTGGWTAGAFEVGD